VAWTDVNSTTLVEDETGHSGVEPPGNPAAVRFMYIQYCRKKLQSAPPRKQNTRRTLCYKIRSQPHQLVLYSKPLQLRSRVHALRNIRILDSRSLARHLKNSGFRSMSEITHPTIKGIESPRFCHFAL